MNPARWFLGVVLLAGAAQAATAPNPMPPPSVLKQTLPNGATVLVRNDPSASLCAVDLWIRAGSADDGATGAAHAVEHMVFRGSANIDEALEPLGCVAYAATYADATHYWTLAPVSQVSAAVSTLCRTLRPPDFTEAAWDTERKAMLEEIRRSHDDVAAETRRALARALFGPAYAAPVAGLPAALNALTPDVVRAFHRTWYRPDQAVLIVVGHVDGERTLAAAAAALGAMPRAAGAPPKHPEPPAPKSPAETVVVRGTEAAAGIAWAPAGGSDAVDIWCEVMRPVLAARLSRLARSVTVSHPWQRAGIVTVVAVGAAEDKERLAAALHAAVSQPAATLSSEQIAAAASRLRWTWWLDHETPLQQARALGLAAVTGDAAAATAAPERMALVAPEDVRAVCAPFGQPDR